MCIHCGNQLHDLLLVLQHGDVQVRSQDVVAVHCLLFRPLRSLRLNDQLSAFALDIQFKQELANGSGFGSHLLDLLALLLLHSLLRFLLALPFSSQLTLLGSQLDIFACHEI